MVWHFYLAWMFMGLMSTFFYSRAKKTTMILLAPLYFGLFILFLVLFLIGLAIVFYVNFIR